MTEITQEAFDDGKFAGVRDDSFFFSPIASNSALMISMKHVMYLLVLPLSIAALVGFDRVPQVLMILIPFFIFMGLYKHRGVHMEFVIYYMIIFLVSWKKEKSDSIKIQKKKTMALFASRSFGLTERKIPKKTTKPIAARTETIEEPENNVEIKLNLGTANKLQYVDVIIGKINAATHTPVEPNGTLRVAFTAGWKNINTPLLIQVMYSGTRKIIGTEHITFEVVK